MRKKSPQVRWSEGVVCDPCEYTARPPQAGRQAHLGSPGSRAVNVGYEDHPKRNLSSAHRNCLRVLSSLPAPFSPSGCIWLWGQPLIHALCFSWAVLNKAPLYYFQMNVSHCL